MTTIRFNNLEDYQEANRRLTEAFKRKWDEKTVRYATETPTEYVITLNVGDEEEALEVLEGIEFEVL